MYAFLADIHIGAGNIKHSDYLKSLDMFLELIKKHKEECHGIFSLGDLFDHRLSIEDAKFAAFFLMNLVCNFCGRNGVEHVPVYFIHGTYTHDQSQYDIFTPMLMRLPNAKVFYIEKACTSTTLLDGKKVLFLPQEYGDVDYTELFKDTYDIIVGHGPIASQNKNPCKSAKYEIIHSAELLGKISKICVFGHYHGYTDFGNNVYYCGPWLQWKYGEDEQRVFFFCNDNFEVETVVNPDAMEFETIEIQSTEQLREYLAKEITNPHRFIINSNHSDMETYRGIINSNKSNLVKFQLEETIDEDDLCLTVDEVAEAQMESVQPLPALAIYIKDKYGLDVEKQLHEYESQINKEDKNETSE